MVQCRVDGSHQCTDAGLHVTRSGTPTLRVGGQGVKKHKKTGRGLASGHVFFFFFRASLSTYAATEKLKRGFVSPNTCDRIQAKNPTEKNPTN